MENRRCGWLAPDGTFVSCALLEHEAVAEELVAKFHYPTAGSQNNDDILLAHGWVRIDMSLNPRNSSLTGENWNEWSIVWTDSLSEQQKTILKPYFDNKIPVSEGTLWRWEKEE